MFIQTVLDILKNKVCNASICEAYEKAFIQICLLPSYTAVTVGVQKPFLMKLP